MTPAQATQLRPLLESDLPPASKILDKPRAWAETAQDNGRVECIIDIRLKTRADADALYAKWVTRWNNYAVGNGITGRVCIHDCTHEDDNVSDCRVGLVWVGS